MTNTMSKFACDLLMREVIKKGTMLEFWRGGDQYERSVTGEGEELQLALRRRKRSVPCIIHCKSIRLVIWSHELSGDFVIYIC